MSSLETVRQRVYQQLRLSHEAVLETVETVLQTAERLAGDREEEVRFPEELPCTVATSLGTVRLEPKAWAAFRYCWYVYRYEGRDEIPFEELGEKIYQNSFQPKSTIQNTIKRGQAVNDIGITYRFRGEYVVMES
ncbi:MAG: hypothetical protein Q4G68_10500 [Planctomycetia bacterium]|nr:hypothetical protein [Planctomycetia bacterium]